MPLGIYNRALRRRGELAGSKQRLEQVNKWHWRLIGLTTDRLGVVAQTEMMPVSGGGAPASARIPAKGGEMQVNTWPWEFL
jgi:hypothetical protein